MQGIQKDKPENQKTGMFWCIPFIPFISVKRRGVLKPLTIGCKDPTWQCRTLSHNN
jgi:hypothetical protein